MPTLGIVNAGGERAVAVVEQHSHGVAARHREIGIVVPVQIQNLPAP